MTTQHAQPLVRAYLDDLDRRLAGAAPGERADIVDAVREHVDIALADLGREPTTADVQQVLADLGPVDSVVAAWSAPASPSAAGTAPADGPTAAETPRSTRWAVVVLLVLGGALVGVLLAPVALVLWFVSVPVLTLVVALSAIAWHQAADARRRARWRATCLVSAGALTSWALMAGALLPFSVTEHEDGGATAVSAPR